MKNVSNIYSLLCDKHFFSSSRPASSTPSAGVEEGAGVEEAGVDEVRQPVAAGRGRF